MPTDALRGKEAPEEGEPLNVAEEAARIKSFSIRHKQVASQFNALQRPMGKEAPKVRGPLNVVVRNTQAKRMKTR